MTGGGFRVNEPTKQINFQFGAKSDNVLTVSAYGDNYFELMWEDDRAAGDSGCHSGSIDKEGMKKLIIELMVFIGLD